MTFQVRQGDVFLRQISRRTGSGALISDHTEVILAVGEATGHAHKVVWGGSVQDDDPAAQLFEEPDGQRYLIVEQACVLKHEEHGPIAIEPGCYRVIIQREYEPEGSRNVLD